MTESTGAVPTNERMRAELTDIITTTIPAGMTFEPEISTGGGCTAMLVSDGSRWIEITDCDSETPYTHAEYRGLCFSYFTDVTPGMEYGQLTIGWDPADPGAYWADVRAAIAAWCNGHPIHGN